MTAHTHETSQARTTEPAGRGRPAVQTPRIVDAQPDSR